MTFSIIRHVLRRAPGRPYLEIKTTFEAEIHGGAPRLQKTVTTLYPMPENWPKGKVIALEPVRARK